MTFIAADQFVQLADDLVVDLFIGIQLIRLNHVEAAVDIGVIGKHFPAEALKILCELLKVRRFEFNRHLYHPHDSIPQIYI